MAETITLVAPDWAQAGTTLQRLLGAYQDRLLDRALADATAQLGRPVRGVRGDPRARLLADRLAAMVPGIVATQRAHLTALIQAHATDPTGLTAALETEAGYAPRHAALIAKTTASLAYNTGIALAAEANGTAVRVRDGHHDATCAALDGTIQTAAWATAHPLQHPRCHRRFSLAV